MANFINRHRSAFWYSKCGATALLAIGVLIWVHLGSATGGQASATSPRWSSPAACSVPSFAPASHFGVATSPRSVAVGDFNSDTNPDLVTANLDSDNVSVLLGNGSGGFGASTQFGVGSSPRSVVVGAFNSDSYPDITVANYNSNTVSVLLGNGSGGFGASTDFAVGSGPYFAGVGRFDADSNYDLVAANALSNSVSVLLGNGSGGFSAPAHFAVGSSPRSVAVGTFNADSHFDLAVANFDSNNVSVLLGDGTGGFGAPTNHSVGTNPLSLVAADFNQDTNLDLAVANYVSDNVSVLLGSGTGGFGVATNFTAGTAPRWVAAGDFNLDSTLDLAVANGLSNNVSILLGNGTGGFAAAANFAVGTAPFSVAVADFNHDTRPDLATANFAANTISVRLNTCQDGTATPPPFTQTSTSTSTAIFTTTPTSTPTSTATPTVSPTPPPQCRLWSLVPSPNQGEYSNELYGVAVVSPNDIWAVGHSNDGLPCCTPKNLILHWDGISWSVVPAPNPGTGSNSLRAIVAVAADDVWAAGYFENAGLNGNFLHWDGAVWSAVPGPPVIALYEGIDAVASDDIWAVGDFGNRTLAAHWDGTGWSVVPTPNVGSGWNYLDDVAAIAADDVWAVGHYWDNGFQTLAIHWDGTEWAVVPTPGVVVGDSNILTSVAAVSTDDVWAVGYYHAGQGLGYFTLALHWDGSAWAVVPTPNMADGSNELRQVRFSSANDGWAVGQYADIYPNKATNTYTLHWDGTAWGFVPSPSPLAYNTLWAVDAAEGNAWAVGYAGIYGSQKSNETLTLRYGYCPPGPTPGPTQTPGGPTATPAQATSTPTACAVTFSDVQPGHTFYEFVRCLACRGIVSGYADGTFHPENDVTRGQLSKIVSNAAGYVEAHSNQTFEDIPPDHTFYIFIERLATRGVLSGYPCGGPGEPCIPPFNRSYFRPANTASRGQLAKIVCRAYGCTGTPTGQTFEDVPPAHTFYANIEQLYALGAINGYPCGNPEPCVPPLNRPYFRPGMNVSRGQTAKIVANVFFPGCYSPSRR